MTTISGSIQLCKYLCILLLVIYTISSFELLSVRNRRRQELRFWFHNLLIFVLHFLMNMAILVRLQDTAYLFFYLEQVGFLLLFLILHRLLYKDSNLAVLGHMMMLLVIGLAVLTRLSFDKAQRQFFYACLAALVSLIIPYVISKAKITRVLALVLGFVGLGALGVVFIRGNVVYGASLSLRIFGIDIQPSEFVKLSYILLLALMLRNNVTPKKIALSLVVVMAHVGILVLSKDIGCAVIFFLSYLFLLCFATKGVKTSLIILGCSILVMIPVYILFLKVSQSGATGGLAKYIVKLFSHVQVRIVNWRDPWSVIDSDGYQITQSLFSIMTGGFLGTGLGLGNPTKIPVVEKDFPFASICEEMGGIFGICVILICLCLLLSILATSITMKNRFYKLMAVGLASMYGVQVFLTVGGVIKMIPHTGVTLPFISYGGSSISSTFFLLAIVQGITILSRKRERDEMRLRDLEAELEETRAAIAYSDDPDSVNASRKQRGRKKKAYEEVDYTVEGIEEMMTSEEADEGSKRGRTRDSKRTKRAQKAEAEQPKTKRGLAAFLAVFTIHSVAFLSLAIYLVYVIQGANSGILNNSYNAVRLKALEESVVRGDILAADKTVLATTQKDERIYPQGRLYAHFTGQIEQGKTGVENLADYYLLKADESLLEQIRNDISGDKPKGYSVQTTILPQAQKAAYEAMDGRQGAVVALDAETGDVLCMVSLPDFDPNEVAQIYADYDEAALAKESFFLNRTVSGLYPPGSSFKPLVLLAYMREFPDYYATMTYDCDNIYSIVSEAEGTYELHCSDEKHHGMVDYKQALAQSCNGFYADLALRVSATEFNTTMDGFGFNRRLFKEHDAEGRVPEVPSLPMALSAAKIRDDMTLAQTAMTGIGQAGVQISPMHSAMLTAAIANGGKLMKPRYLDAVLNENGSVIKRYATEILNGQCMSESEAAVLKDAMCYVVEEGTGYEAKTTDYISGGKTGSAQFISGNPATHAIYTGFGEKDGRIIAIAVFIENGGSGGQQAAPVAKKVLDACFGVE
ncbi:MAG: FtsW/RodA/SpoVE family cell cycle protein [Lachnospiraceae bacterium]|nr:FtsW/RodA/SpoVE family cell cycle protein [Lachnospiraceae bacterium]